MTPPTLHDVYAARERIAPHVPRSPLLRHPLLDEATGLSIRVKHENHNPTCAFKVRGGLNLVGAMRKAKVRTVRATLVMKITTAEGTTTVRKAVVLRR